MRVLLLLFLFLSPAYADEALSDRGQEARAIALGDELRCVVCQSESINDSQADMAHDMRVLVREKITSGWSDAQILQWMQVRYGDFILLKPPVQANTFLLWGLPAFLGIGALGLVISFYRRARK